MIQFSSSVIQSLWALENMYKGMDTDADAIKHMELNDCKCVHDIDTK